MVSSSHRHYHRRHHNHSSDHPGLFNNLQAWLGALRMFLSSINREHSNH